MSQFGLLLFRKLLRKSMYSSLLDLHHSYVCVHTSHGLYFCHAELLSALLTLTQFCRTASRAGRTTGSSAGALEEYRPVVNTLPELTQFLLGQERACQGLLDVLQEDVPGQGLPQVISLCGQTGSGTLFLLDQCCATIYVKLHHVLSGQTGCHVQLQAVV